MGMKLDRNDEALNNKIELLPNAERSSTKYLTDAVCDATVLYCSTKAGDQKKCLQLVKA
jgi:hypothetical protein